MNGAGALNTGQDVRVLPWGYELHGSRDPIVDEDFF
jgi:hypothetical protein